MRQMIWSHHRAACEAGTDSLFAFVHLATSCLSRDVGERCTAKTRSNLNLQLSSFNRAKGASRSQPPVLHSASDEGGSTFNHHRTSTKKHPYQEPQMKNPNGIPPQSPRLGGTSYLGFPTATHHQPQPGLCSRRPSSLPL